ncbi:MAG: outer membrane protein transport protein [Bacteroidota bacterium]|nr:outer membrane protein transport protein [Bacteroidota bacterium]
MEKFKILILITIIISIPLFAQFSEDAVRYSARGSGVGTRALGMGNAYIGVSDDYSATFWNPAGLAQMRRLEVMGGISNVGFANDATFYSAKKNATTSATSLDNLGFVFPFPTLQGSLVFAFGYNRISDFANASKFDGFNNQSSIIPSLQTSATDDPSGEFDIPFNLFLTNTNGYTSIQQNVNQSATKKESGNLGQWSFSGAIDIEENISFGVSLNIYSGKYDYTRNFLESDNSNLYNYNASQAISSDSAYLRFNKFYYDNYLSAELSGSNITMGLMYRSDFFRFGLVGKAPSSIKVSETYTNEGQSVFDAGTWSDKNPAGKYSYTANNEYTVHSPWTFGAGGSVYVTTHLLLAADVEYTDWTQIEWVDNFDLEKGNTTLQSAFRATTNIRLGAEFDIPSTDVKVRGGYSLTPSPYKNDPSSFDQTMFTGGVGILLQRNVSLDGAVAFGSFKSFRNQYSYPINTSRTDESIATSLVNFTVSYRF